MQLPIEVSLHTLREALTNGRNAVLAAPPGAGKTTAVPLALYREPWMQGQRLLMLEPRRLAARSAARRMAAMLEEQAGATVGYRTRLDSRVGPDTRIEVVTEGVLTRMLLEDPSLEGYGAIIFDEFHERSLQADTGLALALEVQQALRPELRLLVMSATLDVAAVAALLGDATVIESPGRQYPVDISYRPPGKRDWQEHCAEVVVAEAPAAAGSTLVFVPGHRELQQQITLLQGRLPGHIELCALAGSLSATEQDRIMAAPEAGCHKVIVATAVAETSLTLPGITLVVDAGYQRLPAFDPAVGMGRLQTRRVSRAAATQRAGRAGRVAPGRAIRLWPEQEVLATASPAEMLSADLAPLVLDLARWGCRDPATLAWLDPPPAPAWSQARELLCSLGLLTEAGALTPLGQQCQRLPLHPRLASMLVAARAQGLGRLGARLALLLSEAGAAPENLANAQAPLPSSLGRALAPLVRGLGEDRPAGADDVGALLLHAFPDRIARRRPGGEARYLLGNGRGAWLPRESAMAAEPWLVVSATAGAAREPRIVSAAAVPVALLEQQLGALLEERTVMLWHDASASVRVRRQRWLGRLLVVEHPADDVDSDALQAFLFQQLLEQGLELLPWTPALRQWRARVRLLASELPGWPAMTDEALLASCDTWLLPFMATVLQARSWKALDLSAALRSLLDYPALQQLDRLAPVALQVPSGRQVAIDYDAEQGPVLEVKLQEMFGLTQTPTVAGKVPVLLHLLSPARRPVAVTRDLASFWQQGYADVRRDLRGRYPKHPWPEDPLQAPAQAGVKKR